MSNAESEEEGSLSWSKHLPPTVQEERGTFFLKVKLKGEGSLDSNGRFMNIKVWDMIESRDHQSVDNPILLVETSINLPGV